ncbi:hypothetical protein Tco_0566831 [Tanacetum coccineum]
MPIHLSRIENPYEIKNVLDPKRDYWKTFLSETLSMVDSSGDSELPVVCRLCKINTRVIRRCVHGKEALDILEACNNGTHRGRGTSWCNLTAKRFFDSGSFGPPFSRNTKSLSKTVTRAKDKEKLRNGMRCLKTPSKFVKSLTFGVLTLWARSRLQEGTNIFLVEAVDYLSKW